MSSLYRNHALRLSNQLIWWIFLLICALYAAYALYMGVVEVFSLLGIAAEAPHRASPYVFVLHALAGGVALITGVLQFNRRLLRSRRALHRALGRVYVGSIWISSISGLWAALFFDVTIAARIALGMVAILWFSTTTIAFLRILDRQIQEHREWMIRSFSLSFFFVTFSFWVPGLANTGLPEAVSFPLAVLLSWSLNLVVAEFWIRYTRAPSARFRAAVPVSSEDSDRLATTDPYRLEGLDVQAPHEMLESA